MLEKALEAKPEEIIRKDNVPAPHKFPTEIGQITINTNNKRVFFEFPHKLYDARVTGITGIKSNGNTSSEVINRPGEDVWFIVKVMWLGSSGDRTNILYRDGVYYDTVRARENRHSKVPRISPHELDFTGNDALLVKAAVDKYMEEEENK
jgi:hypothetical protein